LLRLQPGSCDDAREGSPDRSRRILILGGTGEAAELAEHLEVRTDLAVVSSLAGRVSQPRLPRGIVRVGGFGGVDGLISYLKEERIAAVVDATHPFAVRISHNAEAACAQLRLPMIAFVRPPWIKVKDDLWHNVPDFRSAASLVDSRKSRVFLSIGRQELGSFAHCNEAWFLIRAIEEPTERLPLHHLVLLQRGPFDLEDERCLMRDHSIDTVVSKNSGGEATYSKIEAARSLGIPVVMIKRPTKHTAQFVESIDDVLVEIDRLML
jgi:precorrin-6A/cobalt-precorrin-6A reductase